MIHGRSMLLLTATAAEDAAGRGLANHLRGYCFAVTLEEITLQKKECTQVILYKTIIILKQK
jgi:hypothetical protein